VPCAVEPAAAGRHRAPAFSARSGVGATFASFHPCGRCPVRLSRNLFYGARARLRAHHAVRSGFACAAVPVRLAERSVRSVPARTASARPWPGPARSVSARPAAFCGRPGSASAPAASAPGRSSSGCSSRAGRPNEAARAPRRPASPSALRSGGKGKDSAGVRGRRRTRRCRPKKGVGVLGPFGASALSSLRSVPVPSALFG
jgi:hypothetical protein